MNRKMVSISLGMLLLQSLGLWAQQTASSGIVGQVIDSTQAVVAGANVTITNAGTRAQRTAQTDVQGNFSVPSLPAATYEIRVEKAGFQAAVVSTFDLQIGQIGHPVITLALG